MEIKITTKQILIVLHIISWIIFVGVSIDAGGIIVSTIRSLAFNPDAAKDFWQGIDLSHLLQYDRGQFIVQASLMAIVAMLKATLFYQIVMLLYNKKLDMAQPFNSDLIRFISFTVYLAAAIGFFSIWAGRYVQWLAKQGVSAGCTTHARRGADVWLFMGVVLLIIGQIFKRGAEMQSENELTV
ncbi:DUF2975 domain-containing protein [Chitinophaga sedimenti]|uniref:DUF2975 domain-containing protein n=1 Tax=Chitinophaga sedimenti TaxID=2033606 RepID=UPI0020056289|nr:DUF2975 domain-containing protein [Chitinophaga sedimenti]MCK7557262.1 DUF2975 domain-containing protein [Chitinophaga sedimenti]